MKAFSSWCVDGVCSEHLLLNPLEMEDVKSLASPLTYFSFSIIYAGRRVQDYFPLAAFLSHLAVALTGSSESFQVEGVGVARGVVAQSVLSATYC